MEWNHGLRRFEFGEPKQRIKQNAENEANKGFGRTPSVVWLAAKGETDEQKYGAGGDGKDAEPVEGFELVHQAVAALVGKAEEEEDAEERKGSDGQVDP